MRLACLRLRSRQAERHLVPGWCAGSRERAPRISDYLRSEPSFEPNAALLFRGRFSGDKPQSGIWGVNPPNTRVREADIKCLPGFTALAVPPPWGKGVVSADCQRRHRSRLRVPALVERFERGELDGDERSA